MFERLIEPPLLERLLVECGLTFYQCAYSPLITLWYLMFQRVNEDHTLDAVVTDAHQGGADALSQGKKPLSQRIRSRATTAYNDARQRLPVRVVAGALAEQGGRIRQMAQGVQWRGLWVSLLDGSTVRLRPTEEIVKKYPPHRNGQQKQKGVPGYWCLMRVVVSFCARTGAALACAMGTVVDSEQTLAAQLLWQASASELFIGDRNFGIFRMAQVIRQVNAHALLRMTQARARKLVGRPLRAGREYAVAWAPSCHDKQEPNCQSDPVPGRLLVARVHRKGFGSQVLYLFTTLTDAEKYPMEALVELYAVRWHVELNLRYLKTQMEMDQLESKTPEMAEKEWLAGLLAYNLIRAVMLAAALEAGLDPLELSFCRARRQVERFLEQWGTTRRGRSKAWVRLLEGVACCRLPKRRKPRPPEPRQVRRVRPTFPALTGSRAQARRRCHQSVNQNWWH
jgi:hypothetical protein